MSGHVHVSYGLRPGRIASLSERDLLLFGLGLYAGDGSKTTNELRFTNSSSTLIAVYTAWLRRCFSIDESRLRCRLDLHVGLDRDAAVEHWSSLTRIPAAQFRAPYRAHADATRRRSKYEFGCVAIGYCDAALVRRVLAMIAAVASLAAVDPG